MLDDPTHMVDVLIEDDETATKPPAKVAKTMSQRVAEGGTGAAVFPRPPNLGPRALAETPPSKSPRS